jgi:D-alanyl-D-alanine carboxypeptidase
MIDRRSPSWYVIGLPLSWTGGRFNMRSRLFCLAFLAISIEACAQDVKPAAPPSSFDLDAIDAYVASVVREKGLTGLALSIVRDGKIVLSKGYGKRSMEDGTPVEPDTIFAAGSVTKQFACACVLLLAEDGKLSVDDKVSQYFPELTRGGDITLYQLMTHTSGYPDYYPLDFVDRRLSKPSPIDTIIKEYAGAKLDFEPGARWSYSNTGYLILGRVVEKVSGQSLGAFLKSRILDPVGMVNAEFEPVKGDLSRPRGHLSFALGDSEPARPEADGWLHAAGGLWASTPDLARWDIALMEGRILKPESVRLMTTPVLLNDGRLRDYGCGLSVRREGSGNILSHGGAVSGFRASNTLIPRTKSAVIVLMNDEQSEGEIVSTIVGLLNKKDAVADTPKVDGPPAKEAALAFFHQMQDGKLDRSGLGEEFSLYLTDDRLQKAAPKLKALGEPTKADASNPRERGGLEVCTIRLTFPSVVLEGLMYRSTDGKIQQLLFNKTD